jgi:hypothetical protein
LQARVFPEPSYEVRKRHVLDVLVFKVKLAACNIRAIFAEEGDRNTRIE